MSAALRVLRAGPGATIQDGGRHGYLRFGVTPAGPMDWVAHAIANRLAGNSLVAAALEVSIGGIEVAAEEGSITIGYCGGGFLVMRDGVALPASGRVRLAPGATLQAKPGAAGMWLYLAPAGPILLPPVMGSLSTHTRSGLGGLDGRALRTGDLVPIEPAPASEDGAFDLPAVETSPIRVILGPQDDYFDAGTIATFLGSAFTLTTRMDRMAYRLDGPKLAHAKGFNIISDGIVEGAVQVPGGGFPLVLMADRQPTGGYPKIATVIRADLPRLAQSRPGDQIRFAATDVETGVAELRRLHAAIDAAPASLRPLLARAPSAERLLAENLIGGVVDAETPSP